MYLATAVDVGEADDIHPRNEQEVGRRLALIALQEVYGMASLVAHGPTFKQVEMSPDGRRLLIHFEHAAGLSTTDDQPPRHFAVRSDSGRWGWAEATIKQDTIALFGFEPGGRTYQVRYAYAMNPADGTQAINLVSAGLPAIPFGAEVELKSAEYARRSLPYRAAYRGALRGRVRTIGLRQDNAIVVTTSPPGAGFGIALA